MVADSDPVGVCPLCESEGEVGSRRGPSMVVKRMRCPEPKDGVCVIQWPYVFTSR